MSKLKLGQKVMLINNKSQHGCAIGDIVRVCYINDNNLINDSFHRYAFVDIHGCKWRLLEEDFKII